MLKLEEFHAHGMKRVWEIEKVLYHECSDYQNILIAETSQGVTLFCDYERQSSEATQMIYHQALVYPAVALLAEVKHGVALVLGSSEGVAPAMLAELGFGVDHVDIDEQCVRACAIHLPYGYSKSGALKNSGLCVAIPDGVNFYGQDGSDFLTTSQETYNLIVIDLPEITEENGLLGTSFWSSATFEAIKKRLTPNGVAITQAGCPTVWRNGSLLNTASFFAKHFERVFQWTVPEHEWAWILGTNNYSSPPCSRGFIAQEMQKAWASMPYQRLFYSDCSAHLKVLK